MATNHSSLECGARSCPNMDGWLVEKNVVFHLEFSLPPLPLCGHHPEMYRQFIRSAHMDATDTEGIGLGYYVHVLTAEKKNKKNS